MLEIEEICNVLITTILFHLEFVVAFVVAIFRHIKPQLFEMVQNLEHKMLHVRKLSRLFFNSQLLLGARIARFSYE